MTSDPNRRHVWIHKLWEQKAIMILNSWDQNTPTQLHKQATNVQGQERPQVCRCCYFRTYKVHAWSYPNVEMTLDYKFNKRAVQVQTTIHLDQQLLKNGFQVHGILNSEYESAVTANEIKKMVLKLGT